MSKVGEPHMWQGCASEIWPPTARDDSANDVRQPGSGHERCPTSRTRAEVPNTHMPQLSAYE